MSNKSVIDNKLRKNFNGKIVRKDLIRRVRLKKNVPVYVIEYLIGQYCSCEEEERIEEGLNNIGQLLANNLIGSDEKQKVLSLLQENGKYTLIDKITLHWSIDEDMLLADLSTLGLRNIIINKEYGHRVDRFYQCGIWCILQLNYEYDNNKNRKIIKIQKYAPIQWLKIEIDELKEKRKLFTREEWIDILMRSIGIEPNKFTKREKWLLLARLLPYVESGFNYCEMGPIGTGKSYAYPGCEASGACS